MKKYFYSEDSERQGPFLLEELETKNIKEETLIWFEGLDDWTQAKYIIELHDFFALSPPPITTEEIINTKRKTIRVGIKEPSQVWIVVGFIFALLGGFIGIGIGSNYAFGKYDNRTKTIGWVMLVIGVISMGIWKSI
jgi:hypothetical protein